MDKEGRGGKIMNCQKCQVRPATLHFKQVVNGKQTDLHVCEVCAKENGYMTYPDEGFSLHDLLTGLFNLDSSKIDNIHESPFQQVKELKCPTCKMTFSQFKHTGKFGCAQCYHTFSDHLDPIFSRVHSGNTRHLGKIPKRKGGKLHLKKQIADYRKRLNTLIENEAFEEAAVVRDEIKELESKVKEKKDGDEA